jgi:pimeloyl-ACP methyl ester carboxylesterase
MGRTATGMPRADDLRGLNQLAIDAVAGTVGLVEAMHAAITHLPAALGAPAPGRTRGLTGWIYRRIHDTTRMVGVGVETSLSLLAPLLRAREDDARRDAVLAAMNGVLGDHLEASGNPLAIPMRLRRDGRALRLAPKALAAALPDATGDLLVLIHGLCMNDRQWCHQSHDHGAALSRELGMTPLYLHYNSGRQVARNGADLATLLERAVAAWPVPVERVVLLGHSMGGLVARSACHYAETRGHGWRRALSDVVFVGTPHHGAPLERAGDRFERLLAISPYSAPFALIGKVRSAGIQDLRHGRVHQPRPQPGESGARVPLALPAGVRCHAIAASTQQAGDADRTAGRPRGDGLVPVASALGEHPDRSLDLGIPASRKWIDHGSGHLQLLGSDAVYRRIRASLLRPARTRRDRRGA